MDKYKQLVLSFRNDEIDDELDTFTRFLLENSGPSIVDVQYTANQLLSEIMEFDESIDTSSILGTFTSAAIYSGCDKAMEYLGKGLNIDMQKMEKFRLALEEADVGGPVFCFSESQKLKEEIDAYLLDRAKWIRDKMR